MVIFERKKSFSYLQSNKLDYLYVFLKSIFSGDQPAQQPDRPDRQLLQDVGGLPPQAARSLRQQDLLPRAPDICGE